MSCSPLEQVRQVPRIPVAVDGVEIPYDTIAREVQFHPAATPVKAWQAAARALTVRTLLLSEAQHLELKAAPVNDDAGLCETDEEALIRQLVESEVVTPQPDEAACRRYYEQNRSRFRSATIHEAMHILLAASKDDADAYAARRFEAEQLIDALAMDPGKFAGMARDVSNCASAGQGGNLGQITPGQTTPEFETALKKMSPGEISTEPVESPYGLHIIHLMRRIEGDQLPFDAVRTRISDYLRDRVESMASAQYIARLVSAARITGVEMPNGQDLRVF